MLSWLLRQLSGTPIVGANFNLEVSAMGTLGHTLLAGAIAGVIGIMTSWFITGVLVHPLQAETPNTWRPNEGPAQYAGASAITLCAALIVSVFFALTGGVHVAGVHAGLMNGLTFGVLCWAALALPVLLSMSLFVNMRRGFVLGLMLDWLLVSVIAGGLAGWLGR